MIINAFVRSAWIITVVFFALPLAASNFDSPGAGFVPAYEDTIKYRGYRLDLTNFQILKRTNDWVKLRFDVVNSGRVDVDFGKKGTEHWVQVNFDQTIFNNKLGGLRENILSALHDENYHLKVGQIDKGKEVKVSVIAMSKPRPKPAPPLETAPASPAQNQALALEPEPAGLRDALPPVADTLEIETPSSPAADTNAPCPDLAFKELKIMEQDEKYATLAYTIENRGKGDFQLLPPNKGESSLMLRAFVSGVPTMSKGALPIGGQFVKGPAGQQGLLRPGEEFSGRVRLDVRKKTRYMKCLLVSLDSDQFKSECDKTNNVGSVILD